MEIRRNRCFTTNGLISQTAFNNLYSVDVASIPCQNDENRFSTTKQDENGGILAIGLFDGHNGSFGSGLLSMRYCEVVLETFSSFARAVNIQHDTLDEHLHKSDAFDAILCQAIKQTSEKLDKEIKKQGLSGSTALCLFICQQSSDSLRLYCSNIGDSRCVIKNGDNIIPLSGDHHIKTHRELERIYNGRYPEFSYLPIDPMFLDMSSAENSSINREAVEELIRRCKTIEKESNRITKELSNRESVHVNVDAISSSEIVIDGIDSQRTNESENSGKDDDQLKSVDDQVSMSKYCHGLTRSLGDREAGTSCPCVPEITSTFVKSNEFARCIIAVNGFWDVISQEAAFSMIEKIEVPSSAAQLLAENARLRREQENLPQEDIMCIVVNLYPQNFPKLPRTRSNSRRAGAVRGCCAMS